MPNKSKETGYQESLCVQDKDPFPTRDNHTSNAGRKQANRKKDETSALTNLDNITNASSSLLPAEKAAELAKLLGRLIARKWLRQLSSK